MTAQNYDQSDPDKMKLPAGVTCGDCGHIHRCKAIFGHVETDTTCDWSPSRFVAKASASATIAMLETMTARLGASTTELHDALRGLYMVLRDRHHGRMPGELLRKHGA